LISIGRIQDGEWQKVVLKHKPPPDSKKENIGARESHGFKSSPKDDESQSKESKTKKQKSRSRSHSKTKQRERSIVFSQ